MTSPLVSALAGSLLFFAPLSDNFASKGNAPLGSYSTGQPRYTLSIGTDAELQIINGKLTNTSTSASPTAGYVHANIGKQVSSIGGTFVLQPGSDGITGSADFLIWNWLPLNQIAPESGFHMVITRNEWQLGAFKWTAYDPPFPTTPPQSTLIPYASGTFSQPLPNDGATVLSFSAEIDAAAGTAVLHLPDGTTQTVGPTSIISASPGIGNYPGWEVYRGSNADDKAAFITLFAN